MRCLKTVFLTATISCLMGLWPAALFAATAANNAPLGRLGDIDLTIDEMKVAFDGLGEDAKEAIRRSPQLLGQAVRLELLRKMLVSKAKDVGWDNRPEIKMRIERARQEVIASTYVNDIVRAPRDYPTEGDINAFYEAHKQSFQVPPEYRIAQIFLAVQGDNETTVHSKADQLTAKALKDPNGFGELAKNASEHSQSAAQGGDMGWIAEGQIIPEIRAEVLRLASGEVAGPFRSTQGWHVIKLLGRKPQGVRSLEQVRLSIVATLRLQRAQQNETKYIENVLAGSPSTIDDAAVERFRNGLQ